MKLSVSVVMSVFKHADQVKRTIDSVLAQKGVELELIIVDDGAQEEVKTVLLEYQEHPLVSLIRQDNLGLTKALMVACEQAQYDFIARIDVGDIMLAERLLKQANVLANQQQVGFVTSWASVVTLAGTPLYKVQYSKAELVAGLTAQTAEKLACPVHATVMFRRAIYQQVGGYRPEFYFAQDMDLWLRMVQFSELYVINEALTETLFSATGISGHHQDAQQALAKLALQSRQAQQQGKSDAHILQQAAKIKPNLITNQQKKYNQVASYYFIARCLTKTQPTEARKYYCKALKIQSWHFKSVLGWLQTWF